MKRIRKWLLILSAVFILIVGLGWLLTFMYADEIKQYGVQQLNQLVDTEITVEEVGFSVFRKFPSASLAFKNVRAKEVVTGREKGTLFAARSLYLEFNILKMIGGEYRLQGISLEDGEVNIHIDVNGRDNYHFWKDSEEASNQFVLELEQLVLKNIELTFKNDLKHILHKEQIKKTTIDGKFSAREYDLNIDGLIFVRTYQTGQKVFVKDRNIFLDVSLAVDQERSNYRINKGAFSIEDLHFFLSGDLTLGEEANLANLNFTGHKLSIASLISLVPAEYREELSKYRGEGEIKIDGQVRGWISAKLNPEINVDFSIQQGSIDHGSSGVVLKDIYLSGGIVNGSRKNMSTTVLTIDSLKARFGAGTISGRYKISNFNKPLLDMRAHGTALSLNELFSFLPSDSVAIASLEGNLDLDLRIRGYIRDLSKMTVAEFRKANTLGRARISNGILTFKNSRYALRELQTSLVFNNNDVKVEQLSGKVFDNDFQIDGFFKNLLPYLFARDESLYLRARFHSDQLNWDDFMPSSSEESNFAFPERLSFELQASVGDFKFRHFRATDFRGEMSYHQRRFTVNEATFQSMSGKVSGSMRIDASIPERILFTVDGKAERVNIQEVFNSFDNFGQEVISDKNLKGICTVEVQFSSTWNEKWEIDLGSVHTVANLQVEKGELIDYKPVYSLSRFIEVEELNHIRFSSLQNEIEIRDRKIYIPEMDIQSSALNLSLSGIHSFNNDIDYHFSVLLRDILSKKARKAKKENEEFGGHVEDDGLGKTTLFLKMTGTVDDPKISYDRKGLRKKWEDDLKTEKETIKTILKEEFGRHSKEDKERKPEETREYDFQMEWEENDPEQKEEEPEKKVIGTNSQNDTTKEKKGLNKWLNKITKPNQQEYEQYDPEELE